MENWKYTRVFDSIVDYDMNNVLNTLSTEDRWAMRSGLYNNEVGDFPTGNSTVLLNAIQKLGYALVNNPNGLPQEGQGVESYMDTDGRVFRRQQNGRFGQVRRGSEEAKPDESTTALALDLLHLLNSSDSEAKTQALLDNVGSNYIKSLLGHILGHKNFKEHLDSAKLSPEDALVSLYLLTEVIYYTNGNINDVDTVLDDENLENLANKLKQQRDEQEDNLEDLQSLIATAENDSKGEGEDDDDEDDDEGQGRGNGSKRLDSMDNAEATWRLSGMLSGPRNEGLMEIIGRATEVADESMDDLVSGDSTVSGVTLGSNPANAMAHELAMPSEVFSVKSAEGGLTEYERSDMGTMGRGPVVMVIDQSGSMGGYVFKSPNDSYVTSADMGRAFALACLRTAAAQRRPFVAIQFTGRAETVLTLEDASEATSKDYLAMLTQWMDGGTRLESGLDEARNIVEAYDLQGADIVCFSDGDWETFADGRAEDGKYLGVHKSAKDFADWCEENEVGLITINTECCDERKDLAEIVKQQKPEARAANVNGINSIDKFDEALKETLSIALSTDVEEK